MTRVDLRAEDGWHLDVDRVRQALTARTRLLIANFPNNPTGALADPAAFGELVELVGSVGATLISDELYRGLELGGPEAALPAGVDLAPHVVSVAGVSKVYGLPGARIGWAVSYDRRLMDDLRTYRYWTSLSNSVLSELLALAALRSGEALLARGRVIVQDNLIALSQFMSAHGELFDWVPPRAGTTTFPALRRGSASVLAQRLAEQHSIFLAPAPVLLARGEHLRFGLGRTGFAAGLSALSEALAAPDVLGDIG